MLIDQNTSQNKESESPKFLKSEIELYSGVLTKMCLVQVNPSYEWLKSKNLLIKDEAPVYTEIINNEKTGGKDVVRNIFDFWFVGSQSSNKKGAYISRRFFVTQIHAQSSSGVQFFIDATSGMWNAQEKRYLVETDLFNPDQPELGKVKICYDGELNLTKFCKSLLNLKKASSLFSLRENERSEKAFLSNSVDWAPLLRATKNSRFDMRVSIRTDAKGRKWQYVSSNLPTPGFSWGVKYSEIEEFIAARNAGFVLKEKQDDGSRRFFCDEVKFYLELGKSFADHDLNTPNPAKLKIVINDLTKSSFNEEEYQKAMGQNVQHNSTPISHEENIPYDNGDNELNEDDLPF